MLRESILNVSQRMAARRRLEAELVDLATGSGYVEIETPTLERPTESMSENYRRLHVAREHGERDLALRSDLTPALAGLLGRTADTTSRRLLQVGSVWRGERAQGGRFRESRHFDADIVGEFVGIDDVVDALALAVRCASKWDSAARFRVSHTDLHPRVLEALGVPSDSDLHSRAVRFMRRRHGAIGRDDLTQGLINSGLSLDISQGLAYFRTLQTVHDAALYLKTIGADGDILDDMEALGALLADSGVTPDQVVTDFSMTGIGYYDGVVFDQLTSSIAETPLVEGGSYKFLGQGKPLCGIGFSLDLDRIAALLCA